MTGDPMTRPRIIFFIVLIITGTLVAAGCVSHPFAENNSTEITVSPSTISPNLDQQNDWAYQYRNNLTPAQKKIPAELLPIIDPNFPKDQWTMTTKDLADYPYFIPAENASQELNISESQALEHGGEIKVGITLQPSATLDIIDPFATKILYKNEKWHYVGAWVGMNNLETVASIPQVNKIELLYPGVTF